MLFLENSSVDDQVYLSEVVEYYHQCLARNEQALEFLHNRGITSRELVDAHKIGFADRSLGKLIPSHQVKRGREVRTRLVDLGLFRASSRHEHLRGSITLPMYDLEGNVTNIYGRKVTARLRKGTALHLYSRDQNQGVWNLGALTQSDELLLADSPLNALTLWAYGFHNVTCLNHTELASDELLAALVKHGTKQVTLAFHASSELIDQLLAQAFSLYQLPLPIDQDINGLVCNDSSPDEALAQLLRASRILGEAETPEQRALAVSEPSSDSEDAIIDDDELSLVRGDRKYRARGLAKNTDYSTLRINLLVTQDDEFHQDSINLYSAKHRASFAKLAAVELNVEPRVIQKDLGHLLMALEDVIDKRIRANAKPDQVKVELSEEEQAEAIELLQSPDLCNRIVSDFHASGYVGEEVNLLAGYLATTSRKLDNPLAVVVQSTSAAGKSSLMDSVLDFMPPEDVVRYSAITGQSLYYFSEGALKNKVLAIAEQAGAQKAAYALKVLQSDGELRIASTGKESSTGRMVTQEYVVQGPIMLFETTTEIDLDEELLNRCLVLSVSEERDQTRAIHDLQRMRETLEGQLARRERTRIIKRHRNAQRMLRPLVVTNPYAPQLTFQDSRTRTRRDHAKYLTLIRSVALLHQYQRDIKSLEYRGELVEYIEVTPKDIEIANSLAHEILGRSLDELPPQTRNLLNLLSEMVAEACDRQGIAQESFRFTRKQIRDYARWSYQQVRIHLQRLVDLEYVLVHRSGRGSQHLYELLYDGAGKDGTPFVIGLLDSRRLKATKLVDPVSPDCPPDVGPLLGGESGPKPFVHHNLSYQTSETTGIEQAP